jgi:hypothetical protein
LLYKKVAARRAAPHFSRLIDFHDCMDLTHRHEAQQIDPRSQKVAKNGNLTGSLLVLLNLPSIAVCFFALTTV